MVNSSSYDDSNNQQQQAQDRNAKAGFKQSHNASLSDSKHVSSSSPCNKGFSETADSDLPSDAFAIEPTPTKTEFKGDMSQENVSAIEENKEKIHVSQLCDELSGRIRCSLPLDKVQGVLNPYHQAKPEDDKQKSKPSRKLLCLYCDRSFVSSNLRQKHVERIHSAKQNRRVSSRRQNQLTITPCVYCDKLNSTENTLNDLFHHLVNEHSNKYFGCLPCEERFLTSSLLSDHVGASHALQPPQASPHAEPSTTNLKVLQKFHPPEEEFSQKDGASEEIVDVKVTRSKMKVADDSTTPETEKVKKFLTKKKSVKLKELRSKKMSVKSSRITIRRRESKRIQAITKLAETQKKKRTRLSDKKSATTKQKPEQTISTNTSEKTTKTIPTCINPYPEFDSFYRVKKITDHSIDNLKISSLTFDDVFDKAFFNRIRCNIEENLLHHIDGKLFKNEESESRISNFEKISNLPQETQSSASENYGCEISLNAVTPVASLSLTSQFGEDFESQIEYGSKPSKKKSQTKTDEVVHYKYFTRRKFQASILEHKENRDLSKLDMWTQLVIKKRQQKMLDQKKSAKEMQEYTAGDEYKNRIKREELNRILDRRGPFEDLKEEASKKAALDKLNSACEDSTISHECFSEVREVLNEILYRVFATTESAESAVVEEIEKTVSVRVDFREIPSYLNLRCSSSTPNDEIDSSDKITLICSSQETENFELPTNQVRGKNEIVELSGEWARCRMYICAACGAKLPNMKYLLEHKSLYHQNVWVQHYEFVGNQSELYRHLCIPTLGKVGAVEESVPIKVWKRSDARVCTKCGKQCNSLGELHRHILECGGDWTWMLARKKCRYKPFGAKSRRKRRGLVHRVHIKRKTEPREKKKYKYEGPRQRPSDADSIQRMLANLPAKRSTRKLISLQDGGIYRARKKTQINQTLNKKNKVKCGKVIYKSSNIKKETTEKTINTARVRLTSSTQKNSNSTNRRTLRSLNKVLASRIIDSNPKLTVKRKLRVINEKRRTRQSELRKPTEKEVLKSSDHVEATTSASGSPKSKAKSTQKDSKDEPPTQNRSSPRSQGKSMKKMTMKKLLTGKINIKSFFPIKKRKTRKALLETEKEPETSTDDIQTRSKANCQDLEVSEKEEKEETNSEKPKNVPNKEVKKEPKKRDTFGKLIRTFSMNRNKVKTANEKAKVADEPNGSEIESKTKDYSTTKENVSSSNTTPEDKTSKKRKLKQSFRNVINRVKKLKIDSESPSCSTAIPTETSKIQDEKHFSARNAFLGKSKQNDKLDPSAQPEKIVIPSTLETKENLVDISETAPIVMKFNETVDEPQIPERIFKLESNNEKSLQAKGELDFDTQPVATSAKPPDYKTSSDQGNVPPTIQTVPEMQPISIETSVKPKIVPMVSPNMKGKIRKPTRGLNDCIAMLTSKLQKKTEEQTDTSKPIVNTSDGSKNLPYTHSVFRPIPETYTSKPDCILKIPSFKTHYIGTEETALDLSMKSQSNPELNRTPLQETLWQMKPPSFLFPVEFAKPLWVPPVLLPKRNSIDQTIEEVIEKGKQNELEDIKRPKWSSVDEIIQNVIDHYKVLPEQTKQVQEVSNSRNSVDKIIDFVIATNTIEEGDKTTEKATKIQDDKTDQEASNTKLEKDIKSSLVLPPKPLPNSNLLEKCKHAENNAILLSEAVENSTTTEKPSSPIASKGNSEHLLPSCIMNLPADTVINTVGVDAQLPEIDKSCLDTAIVEISPEKVTAKSKRGRKPGQVRKNSLKKPALKGKILETDVDNILNFEEVIKADVAVTNLGSVTTGEKQEPEIKLRTEDEPHLLENKVLVTRNKTVAPSDSEDEVPLSVLIKADNNLRTDDNSLEIIADSNEQEIIAVTEQIEKSTDCEEEITDNRINDISEELVSQEPEESEDHSEINTESDKLIESTETIINNLAADNKTELVQITEYSGPKDEDLNKIPVECGQKLVTDYVKSPGPNGKRGRGRPKSEKTKKTEELSIKSNIILSETLTAAQLSQNDSLSSSEIIIRGRGRPKSGKTKKTEEFPIKSDIILAESLTATELSQNDSFSSSENLPSLIRGRGRPKSDKTKKAEEVSIKLDMTLVKTPTATQLSQNDCSSENVPSLIEKSASELSVLPVETFKTPKKVKKAKGKQIARKSSVGRNIKVKDLPKRSKSVGDLAESSEPDTDDESLLSLKMSLKLKNNNTISCIEPVETNEISSKDEAVGDKNTNDADTARETIEACVDIIFPPDLPKPNGAIIETSPVLKESYTMETSQIEHLEETDFEMTSLNDSSLTFDKTDSNNFFDSGISDESLENLEQRDKIKFPKRRSQRSKPNKTNSESSQTSTTDSSEKTSNATDTYDKSEIKGETPQKSTEIRRNRSSRSLKRNSEFDLSDSSNSTFDTSNDNTPDIQTTVDYDSDKFPLTPKSVEKIEAKNDVKTVSELDMEIPKTITSMPSTETFLKITETFDIADISDQKEESNQILQLDEINVKLNDLLEKKTKLTKIKPKRNKPKFNRKKSKARVIESPLTKTLDDVFVEKSGAVFSEVETPSLTITALEAEVPEVSSKLDMESIVEIPEAKIQNLLENNITTVSLEQTLELNELLEPDTDEVKSTGTVAKGRKFKKKITKINKLAQNNISLKRSSSVSSISSLETKPITEESSPATTTKEISTKSEETVVVDVSGIIDKLARNSRSSKAIRKTTTSEDKVPNKTEEIDLETTERRSRSARNKVINYAENDDNDTADSSTPQSSSVENSPEKDTVEREVSMPKRIPSIGDIFVGGIEKSDVTVENLSSSIETNQTEGKNIEPIFTKPNLRIRKIKGRRKIIKKRKKIKTKKVTQNASKTPSKSEDFKQIMEETPEEILLGTTGIQEEHFCQYIPTKRPELDGAPVDHNSVCAATVIEKQNIQPEVMKEPPIKIIINKQKTRRKSKSFRKVDIKGQNDLFKDFALVIKKPKRLVPIITFSSPNNVTKETYPTIAVPIPEPVITFEKPDDNKDEPDETLDESVEEMDMELDEIPITSNIIERNTLPEIKGVNVPPEAKDPDNISKKAPIKLKTRKIKSRRTRFTKKRNKKKVDIVNEEKAEINSVSDIIEKTHEIEKNYDIVPILTSNIDLCNAITETNEEPTVNVEIAEIDGNNVVNSEESTINVETDEIDGNNIINSEEPTINVETDEIDGTFTITSEGILPEKPILKIMRNAKGKNKRGKFTRKKLIISFRKNKDSHNNFTKLQTAEEPELIPYSSVNNNSLLTEETDKKALIVDENVTVTKEKADSSLAFPETAPSPTEDVVPIETGRKLRKSKLSKKPTPKQVPNTFLSDDMETKSNEAVDGIQLETYSDYSPSPRKENLPKNLPIEPLKQIDRESVYTFDEHEDFEIETPIEIPRRIPRIKPIPLPEPVVHLELLDPIHTTTVSEDIPPATSESLSRKKNSITSESIESPKPSKSDVTKESTETFTESTSGKDIDEEEINDSDLSKPFAKKKEKSLKENPLPESCEVGAIKENDETIEDNARRKSVRSAKVKALEHIHDEALAELKDSERNRDIDEVKAVPEEEDVARNGKKLANKKSTSKIPQLLETLDFPKKIMVDEKTPSFADLVADLAGLEELENSIERELNTDDDDKGRDEQSDLEMTTKEAIDENSTTSNNQTDQDNSELRRSRRGSRKIASYNENDLVDPLLDIIDKKKRGRKKDGIEKTPQNEVKTKKMKEEVKQQNSDELFDLIKSGSDKPLKSFSGTINRLKNDENASDMFIDDVITATNPPIENKTNDELKDPDKIYEFTESSENTDLMHSFPVTSKKKANKNDDGKTVLNKVDADKSAEATPLENISAKPRKSGTKEKNFCELCNKSFIRIENLIKHKRTLTHIQKLSEFEAKQAEEKSKSQEKTEDNELVPDESPSATFDYSQDINIHNILLESEKPDDTSPQVVHSSFPNNESLKLVDIISDVLNKPSLATDTEDISFMDLQNSNDIQPELRRYKSLGERKSFDSDSILNTETNALPINEPYISKTTILEKQISLLENIIENQAGVNYLDDISISSNNSIIENTTFSSKHDDSSSVICKDKTVVLNNAEESFLKPTQYEEISEDSVNLRNYEDQKLRKTLNRDEELFLECCSLLKSGSEVSSYSNQRSQKVINRLTLKQFDEPECMEDKCLAQKADFDLENDYSYGNSRIPTPLGDSYDDDASNSNTISSNWDINKMEPVFDDNPNGTSNLNFQEVLNKTIFQDKSENLCDNRKPPTPNTQIEVESVHDQNKKKENTNTPASESKKKIITKGARKVFEGLKVSIPTEELNLEEVLNCSPKCKKLELQILQQSTSDEQSAPYMATSPQKPSRNARKSKPVKKAQVGSNLLFKMKKKKTPISPDSTTTTKSEHDNAKCIDVYDFEETQDNTDVFTKPDFRAFRSKKSNENIGDPDSDNESRDDYLEPFIAAEPDSITSSLSSSSSLRKSTKAQENITKKKCMIMGRIFKHQAKSKMEDIDEEMRDIPIIDNEELVENYVANCKIIKNEAKPKLSETEINQLFDQLLENKDTTGKEDDVNTSVRTSTKSKTDSVKDKDKDKKVVDGKKKKLKTRKRVRTNSESTDDEFNLNKSSKRVYRKNGKAEDNSINLEQELKECIGVASRKSQRKCTSGKQNVLVEYWSSDESQFEALLENQKIEQKPKVAEVTKAVPEEKPIEPKKSESEFQKVPTILKPPPRPKALKRPPKKKHSGSKDKTLNLNLSNRSDQVGINRRKRAAANPLYHWSSSSEDESQDLIEIKPLREDEEEFEDDRPVQHGWIVGESPKKLVTMLAQAKGKKLTDTDCVKEQGRKRTTNSNS